MSDFIYQQQADEMVDGQYYNGEYQPTEQDLADMNEAWNHNDLWEQDVPVPHDYDFDFPDTESDVYHEAFYDHFADDNDW